MICQRCAKDVPNIHTCSPSALVRELEAERALLIETGAASEQQRDELLAAAEKTIEENGHLADGDNCTLKVLKDAIANIKDKP